MFITIPNDKINNLVLFIELSNDDHETHKICLPDPIFFLFFFPTKDVSFISVEQLACARLCVQVIRTGHVFRKWLEVLILVELFWVLEVYIFHVCKT